jgi:NitT/TauT family transport system permease protein
MMLAARALRYGPSVALVFGLLCAWEAVVRLGHIEPVILPAPSLILATLISDRATLLASLGVTLETTFTALLAATLGGLFLAILFSQWKWLERALLPVAVTLQVTPIIAIAPLLLVYLMPQTAVLVCAFLVAFFPILANAALGLASADRNLVDLFQLYSASRWQSLLWLRLPAALPNILAGVRIGGGLALIGAIAGELAAGASGKETGLAFRIIESGYLLDTPRMFAALALISLAGIAIFILLSGLSHLLLRRWHESALSDSN